MYDVMFVLLSLILCNVFSRDIDLPVRSQLLFPDRLNRKIYGIYQYFKNCTIYLHRRGALTLNQVVKCLTGAGCGFQPSSESEHPLKKKH